MLNSSRIAHSTLEKPLRNTNHISRPNLCRLVRGKILLSLGAGALYVNVALVGFGSVATREGNSVQCIHVAHIRVLSRLGDFSDNVERPVIDDLDADARILQIPVLVKRDDLAFESADRESQRSH